MAFIKKLIFLSIFIFKITFADGQFGGWSSYTFLNMPTDAFTTSLGGQNVAAIKDDPSLFLNNPALNQINSNQYLKINFVPLWAGTNSSSISYGKNFNKIGNISTSLQYLNYGSFQGTDAAGNLTNQFKASDFAFTIGHSQKVNNISIGVNLKLVGSNIETYSALAVLADFGGYFKHPKKEISYGLVIKNMGARIKNFNKNDAQSLPFNVQMGASFRAEQMPIRFSVTAHHIHQWDILVDQADERNIINNQIIEKKYGFGNKIASHIILGIEALINENFQLNFGYNHLLRQELKLENQFTLAGFSTGFLLKTKKINFSVGSQGFHPARGLTQFSICTNLK